MREKLIVASLVLVALTGCKKQVPSDIVDKSMKSALRHAPVTAAAMCGGTGVKGMSVSSVLVTERGKEANTGTVHVKGTPLFGKDAAATCEGDLEYAYSYDSRKVSRNTTRTTWYLKHLKLKAVQTKGVTFKSVDEDVNDDDDDGK